MMLWQLPQKTTENQHDLKYRLYYGLKDGTCVVRYNNETGKGDHMHKRDREEPYQFRDVEILVGPSVTLSPLIIPCSVIQLGF